MNKPRNTKTCTLAHTEISKTKSTCIRKVFQCLTKRSMHELYIMLLPIFITTAICDRGSLREGHPFRVSSVQPAHLYAVGPEKTKPKYLWLIVLLTPKICKEWFTRAFIYTRIFILKVFLNIASIHSFNKFENLLYGFYDSVTHTKKVW